MTQVMEAASAVYTLPMADVALWSGDEALGPVTKLWTCKSGASIRVSEQAEVVERRLTGMPHPKRRIIITGYSIEIDQLFDNDVHIEEDGEYILVATFNEAALHSTGLKWIKRTFYGVQVLARDGAAGGVDPMNAKIQMVANFVEDETSP